MYTFGELQLESGRSSALVPGVNHVYQYLRDRGIPQDQIDGLGLVILPAQELITRARGASVGDQRLACVFPHYGMNGQPIDWWSARLIDSGIAEVVPSFKQRRVGKMFCPPNEPPHAYLVPTLDWGALSTGANIYIHESCIKAITGADLGYWSIGLNGVWGWKSKKHEIALVEELRGLPWKGLQLNPIIVFDSNAGDNWDIQHAIQSLAAKIYEVTGRHARHLTLPRKEDGGHWGFDDYRVVLGDEAARAYLDACASAPEVEISGVEALKLQLNSEVCVVRSLGVIAEQRTGTLMSRGTFCLVNYATYLAQIDDKVVRVPELWLGDPRRTEVELLEYTPGGDPIVPGKSLNLWRGMGVEPQVGDVSLWLQLLEHQIPDEAQRKWFMQWMAYPLQHPGAKLHTFVHLYGPPRSGKGSIVAPLREIYGSNFALVSKENMLSQFNSLYTAKQLVYFDEVHTTDKREASALNNKIKLLVTDPTVTVNAKGQKEYSIRNCFQIITSSNYPDSVKLDEGDRRAFVLQFGQRDNPMPVEFWDAYWGWLNSGAGAPLVYGYLMGLGLGGFDPKGVAMHTEWKDLSMEATRSSMEQWVHDLWYTPDAVLPPLFKDAEVLTPEQLGAAYYPDAPEKNTPGLRVSLGLYMLAQGFKRTELIKVDGRPRRFWVLCKRALTNEEIRVMYTKVAKVAGRSKF